MNPSFSINLLKMINFDLNDYSIVNHSPFNSMVENIPYYFTILTWLVFQKSCAKILNDSRIIKQVRGHY